MIFFHTQTYDLQDYKGLNGLKIIGFIVLVVVILYMGGRPISYRFGDMGTYNRWFLYFEGGGDVTRASHDILFNKFIQYCSQIMTNKAFFFVCALLYIIPTYFVSKKWFKEYWVYAFIMLIGSFSFWAYGTNGIRNGLGTSFFLMGLSREKKIFQALWFFLAINFHGSLIIPVIAYVIALFYKKPKYFFYFWLLCIPLSLFMGGFFTNFFAGFVDQSRSVYLTGGIGNDDEFSKSGFRWDFLLYSAAGVFAAWYYIFKKKINDKLYNHIVNTYLIANGFWILVINVNFSNRFAYLSWFLLALVIVYPWLKYSLVKEQNKQLGYLLLIYFGFTYLMNVIIYVQ